ncbi:hypothetical protein ZHAS_00012109 [Anopheles sinensis]|uniref:Uncharacterized protein n=1 Tax=Anopheles sinensis TaxID=74873 RepID=A0A084W1X3_ANOSI|nr:hypothetical protein ZHAS_00012109 [Anopheles sinensis]
MQQVAHYRQSLFVSRTFANLLRDDANGYGNDGYNGLSGRTSSLPSIFPSGNQLLPTDEDGYKGDPRDGQLGTGGTADDTGHHGGARKKVRFRKSKLRQLYDVDVLPVEYMGPKIEYR